jgi:hypothetical protein
VTHQQSRTLSVLSTFEKDMLSGIRTFNFQLQFLFSQGMLLEAMATKCVGGAHACGS